MVRSNCDCAVRSWSRTLMTYPREEVRICHVGLCVTHLHSCSWSLWLTLKLFICFQREIRRPFSTVGSAPARRHVSTLVYIEAGRRCGLGSSSWKPTTDRCILVHFTLMYVVDVVWVVLALWRFFYRLFALNFANQLVAMSFPIHLVLKPLSPLV